MLSRNGACGSKDTPEDCKREGVDDYGVDVRLWKSEANGLAEASSSERSEANDQKLAVSLQILVTDDHAGSIGLSRAEIDVYGVEARICASELHEADLDIDDQRLEMRL